MKNLLLFLVLFTSVFPQQFNSLDGIEAPNGETILLYRLGDPIYKFNVQNGYEEKIMDAYSGLPSRKILDYEFFPNDISNFINVGFWGMNINFYIARNDIDVCYPPPIVRWVDISKQNPQKVFVFGSGGGPIRSWDGGHTFPFDSIPAITNFNPIALSNFDDEIMFGFNEDNEFCRNAIVVDTSLVSFDEYFKMLYDINQFHIYRINWTYGGYSLNVSNNKGDANSWTKTYQSENPLYITIDSTQSGVIYLADGRSIYKSVNNGYNFYPYKTLPRKIVGLYKKPNSEILYAVSKYQLYKIEPDTISIIKSIPISSYDLAYYPLKIGNKWIYSTFTEFIDVFPVDHYGTNKREVLKDTLLSNGKIYFKVYDFTTLNYTEIFFERIDTATGLVYRFNEETNDSNYEYLIDDLLSEVGDTISSYRDMIPYSDSNFGNVCVEDGSANLFGQIRAKKSFVKFDLSGYSYNLVNGVGIDSIFYGWDFGYSLSKIKGFIIDGIVYGDTTITNVNQNTDLIPSEYKLEQNYPNPFNPSTTITYQIPEAGNVTLKVFDLLGEELITLVDEYKSSGKYDVQFNASNFPSGVYFCRLQAGLFVQIRKMILIK